MSNFYCEFRYSDDIACRILCNHLLDNWNALVSLRKGESIYLSFFLSKLLFFCVDSDVNFHLNLFPGKRDGSVSYWGHRFYWSKIGAKITFRFSLEVYTK